jgi:ketosteroid isomerase-like protein
LAEELEKARSTVAAGGRGDLDAALEHLSPGVEMDMSGVPGGALLEGRDAVAAYLREHGEAWGETSVEIEAAEQHGNRVIVVQVERNVGRLSGAEVESRYANVFEFEDGMIARARFYDDLGEAYDALRR